ncbi:arylsulfatase B [Kiritimatiella glycovorans]|uniref:Arylsulfatase n=1 Tax=Kiritimatiella glycovorans TaxID=1307763 RepID=A0A0G3EAF5_9BACT|nr:arylsulfatase [Kiritimatiella glycovorans]AKJ63421.1 Arylsulfatase [Kiritimatiella glycovorans]
MNIVRKVALAAVVWLGATVAFGAASRQPNVVLVMADDLGWGDVGYHGGEAATPNIDRISSQGVRFSRFYAQPICSPTRAALMTGRYAWRSGMASGVVLNHLDYGLPLDEVTLGEVMKSAGYGTYCVGKWHLGHVTPEYLPTERGFDYHYGLYTAIDHFTHKWNGALDWHRNREPLREEGYATDLLGDDCVRIIEEHEFDEEPMFLYHPMFAVHAWNQSTEEYMAPYSDVKDPKRRGLLGLIAAMDNQFGRIVDALEARGQLQNTLVFFLSDNGGCERQAGENGPLRAGKGSYYEGGVRVPAFAYWLGKIEGGRTSDALAHAVDIMPTLANLVGAELPDKPIDGRDLAPVLFEGAESTGREEIVFILEDSERLRRGAIIDWPWKLRRTAKKNGPWVYELFNIREDPYEKDNAYEKARAHPEIVDRLSRRLDHLKKEAPPALWQTGDGDKPEGWEPPEVIGPDA